MSMLKNKYVRNSLMVLVITTLLLLIDLLLKHYLFEPGPDGMGTNTSNPNGDWNITIIAGRSLLHTSTTFLDFIGGSLPKWGAALINFAIIALFLSMAFFSKSKGAVVGLAIALAGIFGNTMDNLFHDGVRDVFFVPWWDRGTFNLADCLVVVGAVTAGISFFVSAFKK